MLSDVRGMCRMREDSAPMPPCPHGAGPTIVQSGNLFCHTGKPPRNMRQFGQFPLLRCSGTLLVSHPETSTMPSKNHFSTLYLSAPDVIELVQRKGVEACLRGIADDQTYAFKYVNGHPKNTRWGLPTVMAFGVLADVATGAPLLLSELTLTTAL